MKRNNIITVGSTDPGQILTTYFYLEDAHCRTFGPFCEKTMDDTGVRAFSFVTREQMMTDCLNQGVAVEKLPINII